jgi:hypothetical protein
MPSPIPQAATLDPSWNDPKPASGALNAMTAVGWIWIIIVLMFFLAMAIS